MARTFTLADIEEVEDKPKVKPKRKFKLGDVKEKTYDQSAWEAGARGIGQGLFGLGDEMVGGAQAAYDLATGKVDLKELVDRYKKYRDIERDKVKHAYETQPAAAYAGEIGTSFIPFLGVASKAAKGAKLAASAKAGALQGAASGYGTSEKEAKDIGGLAKDIGAGAAIGGALGSGLHLGAKALKGGAKGLVTKPTAYGAGILLDRPGAAIEKYMKGRRKFGEDVTAESMAKEFTREKIPGIREDVYEASKKSRQALEKYPGIPKSEIRDTIKEHADDLERSFKGIYDDEKKVAALKKMRDLQEQYGAKKTKTSLVDERGKPIEIAAEEVIDPGRLKDTIQSLDNKIDYQISPGQYVKPDSRILQVLRSKLDAKLKDKKDYAHIMDAIDDDMRLLKDVESLGKSETSFKNIFKRVGKAEEGEQITPREVLEKVGKRINDPDLLQRAEFASAKDALGKDATHGSRMVNKATSVATAMSPNYGTIFGPILGSTADQFAGKIVKSAVDRVARLHEAMDGDPEEYGRLVRALKAGIAAGQPEAIATRAILREMDKHGE